jgi:hypothetical protein
MPDYENIYVNGFNFACDVDMGIRPSRDDPGEPGEILEIYIENEDGLVPLPKPWPRRLVDIICLYIFHREEYEEKHGKNAK